MENIKLERAQWRYDDTQTLGEGGYGKVFVGQSLDGEPVAVKMLSVFAKKSTLREMKIVRGLIGRSLSHVVPVLDCGMDAETDDWFIVMPKADTTLRNHLDANKPLSFAEVLKILRETASGLMEIPELTHRDIKPANILKYGEAWCVADFGLAKLVEEATSSNTLKEGLTSHYAAPEQWTGERATSATDVYALGCVAHVLVNGRPPFDGDRDEIREHHLNTPPTELTGVPPVFQNLVTMMLRKVSETRPSLKRVFDILETAATFEESNKTSKNDSLLATVAAEISQQHAIIESEIEQAKRKQQRRLEIGREACNILRRIARNLANTVQQSAPNAQIYDKLDQELSLQIFLGGGRLNLRLPHFDCPYTEADFTQSGKNVLLFSDLSVSQGQPSVAGRSANLIYMCEKGQTDYRWREVCFMDSPLVPHPHRDIVPFSMKLPNQIDTSMSRVMSNFQLGAPVKIIDDEFEEEFIARWLELFARAAKGVFKHPSSLPLK